jgi:hypothetical protein
VDRLGFFVSSMFEKYTTMPLSSPVSRTSQLRTLSKQVPVKTAIESYASSTTHPLSMHEPVMQSSTISMLSVVSTFGCASARTILKSTAGISES